MERKSQRARARRTLLIKLLAALQIVFFAMVWMTLGRSYSQWPLNVILVVQAALMIGTIWYGVRLSSH